MQLVGERDALGRWSPAHVARVLNALLLGHARSHDDGGQDTGGELETVDKGEVAGSRQGEVRGPVLAGGVDQSRG